ncbi:MAG: hypothetical protein E6I98_14315 [Chloroflexi bacterium]|nr:MAG: hypothetical protein E6I98_14315 [Chloroflexota bacterium]
MSDRDHAGEDLAVKLVLGTLERHVAHQYPRQGAAQQKARRDDAGRGRKQAESKAQLPLPASSSR